MTSTLPPRYLALFAPRPPLRYLTPADTVPEKRKTVNINGVAAFLKAFDKPDINYVATETADQIKEKRRAVKLHQSKQSIKEALRKCMLHIRMISKER
jgi:U1 small nuclear ribonucleoprotein 70kDa